MKEFFRLSTTKKNGYYKHTLHDEKDTIAVCDYKGGILEIAESWKWTDIDPRLKDMVKDYAQLNERYLSKNNDLEVTVIFSFNI